MMSAKRCLPVLALALTAMGVPAAQSEGFGRWQGSLRQCQLIWTREDGKPSQPSPCQVLRLDQTIEGLLRIRFINAAASSRLASEELIFVGLLRRQDTPMQCTQGSCDPRWPMRVDLQGVTSLRFNGRGLAEHLPQVHLAQGNCQLEPPRLRCEAKGDGGLRWLVSAELRSPLMAPTKGHGGG